MLQSWKLLLFKLQPLFGKFSVAVLVVVCFKSGHALPMFPCGLTDVRFHHAVVHAPDLGQIHTAVQKHRTSHGFKDVTQDFRRLDSFLVFLRNEYKRVCGNLCGQ